MSCWAAPFMKAIESVWPDYMSAYQRNTRGRGDIQGIGLPGCQNRKLPHWILSPFIDVPNRTLKQALPTTAPTAPPEGCRAFLLRPV